MVPSILELVSMGLGILSILGVMPKARAYFSVRDRSLTWGMISGIAQRVIALVASRKGISPEAAAGSQEALQLLEQELLQQKLAKNKAREIAARELAAQGLVSSAVVPAKVPVK